MLTPTLFNRLSASRDSRTLGNSAIDVMIVYFDDRWEIYNYYSEPPPRSEVTSLGVKIAFCVCITLTVKMWMGTGI